MRIYQLEAAERLSKVYKKTDSGFDVTSYPMVRDFTSVEHNVNNPQELFELIQAATTQPNRCLLKGELLHKLTAQSRAGATSPRKETSWLCLDFDYVTIDSQDAVDSILQRLGLGDVSYVLQYGAGHQITKSFSAHLYFMLDAPVLPSQLKLWLKNANFVCEELTDAIQLTKTDCALSWPLDISLAQNDKLIYTAAPECIGFSDPADQRVFFFARRNACAKLSNAVNQLSASAVEARERKMIAELREKRGLPKKTLRSKNMGSIRVLSNPDKATVTGAKNERGYTYLNLNGGDSWGYYFPETNPEVVFNFKSEPNYLLRDLDQDFYRDYKAALAKAQGSLEGKTPFAFLDRATDKYYRGFFHPDKQELEIYSTDSLRKVADFAKQSGLFLDEYVPEWDYRFVFDSDVVFDPENRFANRYVRTPYLREELGSSALPEDIPPTIKKILFSVVGGDRECVVHFLNWLACIVQYRQRTQTAWVFTGREGTGKGVLFNYILSPIIGAAYCKTTRLSTLEEDFNGFMEETVILMVDESKSSQLKNQEKAMALLRNVIVEPKIQIRRMRTDAYMVNNYLNVIIASNHPDAIHIPASDRRYNVGHYQPNKLNLTAEDIACLEDELWDFVRILRSMTADAEKAKTPLMNQPRSQMMYLTQTSIEVAAQAILDGNLEFFIDMLPTDNFATGGFDAVAQMTTDRFIEVLREAELQVKRGEPHRLTRDQCKVLMAYVIGDVPKTANKFTNFMKHYNIFFSRRRKDNKLVQAIEVQWKKSEVTIDDYISQHTTLRAVK